VQTGGVRTLIGVAVLAAFLAMPAAAAAPSGRIVFVREVGDESELFSIRPDRSGLKRLTREAGFDRAPAWSPNGRLIASFGANDVVIRTGDGSAVRRVPIPVEGFAEELRWSPDGRWLSYLVEHCSYEDPRGYVVSPCADLWVVRPDGSSGRRLLDRDVAMVEGASYSWSPDSRRLVYEVLTSGPTWLAVIDLRSGARTRIPGTAGAADPVWSPRGGIAFVLRRGLFVARGDGRGLRRLVRGQALARPAWTRDGRRIAYLSAERARVGNRWGVWVARADGKGRRRVGTATDDPGLVWSPDSRRLVWENDAQRLFVADSNRPGSAKFLTRGSDPDWR
jgi:Tol biopolymer transport system component